MCTLETIQKVELLKRQQTPYENIASPCKMASWHEPHQEHDTEATAYSELGVILFDLQKMDELMAVVECIL